MFQCLNSYLSILIRYFGMISSILNSSGLSASFNLLNHYGMNKVGGINIEFLSVVSIHCILRSGKFIATPIPFLAVKQSSNNHFYIYSRHILHTYHKKYFWWLVFLEIELGMKVIKDDYIIFKIWNFSCSEAMLRRYYMTSQKANF